MLAKKANYRELTDGVQIQRIAVQLKDDCKSDGVYTMDDLEERVMKDIQ